MSLAQRTITSTLWSFSANSFRIAVLLVRSILLARWLPVEVFGIYGFALAIVTVTVPFVNFGMDSAFLHRTSETKDEARAAAIFFTLRLILTALWTGCLLLVALLIFEGAARLALVVLALAAAGSQLAGPTKALLTRRVVHRRLSLIVLSDTVLATGLALTLAWYGVTLWSLLAIEVVGAVVELVMLYVWRPVWRPRLAWIPESIHYFLSFGLRSLGANLLVAAIDKVGDLWTGFFLGEAALGYYNRAFAFARYPRLILADPVTAVIAGTYAELKGDRLQMSRVFFRVNAVLIRSSFLIAGALALVAPELIRLVLGDKWLPMIEVFRLMLVFTMLDPIRKTTGFIFIAVGRPGQLLQIRFVQLVLLVILLFILGITMELSGVALAVNIVLLFGILYTFHLVKAYVDFSYRALFLYPVAALASGILGAAFANGQFSSLFQADWQVILIKSGAFMLIYAAVLLVFEFSQTRQLSSMLYHYFEKEMVNARNEGVIEPREI